MHVPVLTFEMIDLLNIPPGATCVDGTFGGGGHTAALLDAAGPDGRVVAFDRDPDAIARGRSRFEADSRVRLIHANFESMEHALREAGVAGVDAIVLDLGVSSFQLDEAARGFSFRQEGPLDMRMDPTAGEPVSALIQRLDERALADAIWRLGEEPDARRIASAIVRARSQRPVETTAELAQIVREAKGGRRGAPRDPATKTFQGLRLLVNGELDVIEPALEAALRILKVGGRLAVISFHSLEDRPVKRLMAAHVGRDESLAQGGSRWVGLEPACRWITRKAVQPSSEECARNPRARSAKLRVVERIR